MFDKLKTTAGIAADIIRGRAFAETIIPKKRNAIKAVITRANGVVEELPMSYNSRVNAGAAWQAGIMGSATAAPANYIALSTATLTPAATDTTLASEITSGTNSGLARAQGTYGSYSAPGSLGGSASYQISKTFTSSASTTVQSAALFNASSSGTMFVEANLTSSATLASGDQLTITWTIQI